MEKRIGCLLIHGFGGNIGEMLPLIEYLNNQGFITLCPELKGHTGKRGDLAHVKYMEWIESAEEGLHSLKCQCDAIVLIGFSMGGLIAANLAVKYKISAMITLNMPIYYWDFKRIAVNIKNDFRTKEYSNLKYYIRSSFDKPLSALANFRMLLKKTKYILKEVQCPILIVQALEDDTVHWKSANYIYDNVSSNCKKIRFYKDSGHLVCHSSAAGIIFSDIADYINNILYLDAEDTPK